MDFKEKTLKQEYKYKGRVINVRIDDVQLVNGEQALREVVEHPGGVTIALEDTDGTFFMVTQWRYAQEKTVLEFPAGKLEKGEDPFESAKREIVEETGYEGIDYVDFGEFIPTGAYGAEKIHLYYAKKGKFMGQHLDEDENLAVSKMTLQEIIDDVMDGKITDGKTMALAFKVKEYKERHGK